MSAIFNDPCPKCNGELVSSVGKGTLLEAMCLDCGYEPSLAEYEVLCEEWDVSKVVVQEGYDGN